jgi:hypothetical protein
MLEAVRCASPRVNRPIRHLFLFIGAEPKGAWLSGCVELDPKGFVYTGESSADDGRQLLETVAAPCLPSVMSDRARSSASQQQSARARKSSRCCMASWQRRGRKIRMPPFMGEAPDNTSRRAIRGRKRSRLISTFRLPSLCECCIFVRCPRINRCLTGRFWHYPERVSRRIRSVRSLRYKRPAGGGRGASVARPSLTHNRSLFH